MPLSAPDPATRILIFAPIGRDAALTQDLLSQAGIVAQICASGTAVSEAINEGAAAVILTEEILETGDFARIAATLRAQPPWSDMPVLLFTGGQQEAASGRALSLLEELPNITLLDRPLRVAVAISLVRAAIRARRRQLEVRDLLEALEMAREQAETANRLKDEFLATLSHELRTPLNAILGWTAILRNTHTDATRLRRGLEVIDRNAQAQTQLVEDVLDMARVITGKLRMELKPVHLQPIIDAAIESMGPAADAKGIRVVMTGADERVMIRADPDRLQQVLWNLLSNAVKFTPDNGHIDVILERRDSYVIVSVRDSGAGLDPHFLPYVFDRFRQADQTVTRGHGGLGLGLAIVKHLVELHGGRVSAASDGIGHGSTFSVRLPIPAVLPRRASESADDDPFAIRLHGVSLLVVDDDASTRELLRNLFEIAHARVHVADTAAAAFASFCAEPPDLLIADIGLPVEDGLSLMRRIRALQIPAADLPALALSAYTRTEDAEAARAAGFTDFLGKPASPQVLLRLVERLLSRHAPVRRRARSTE
ncbi:MAG TPA: ATP-binding protein [Vicinamibacterales bacterium]|nr:ATP-binding protein [Vicinamibacterales bacterium]